MSAAQKPPDPVKLAKALDHARELVEKLRAVHDELDDLIGGRAAHGVNVKAFLATYSDLWTTRYRSAAYAFDRRAEIPHVGRLLRLHGLEELSARAGAFIRDEDQWLVTHRHPFRIFARDVNKYAGLRPTGEFDLTAPFECHHSPGCRDAVMHTRRARAEVMTPR